MRPQSEEALLGAVKELVAIESTANNPAGLRAAYEQLRRMVLDRLPRITIEEFEQNGKPSFLAYRSGQRPDRFHIILNAHVDVVPGTPDQYGVRIEGSRLYGRGIYDMKAAAVVLAEVFCEYVDRVPYALGLQIVTDEESAGERGTQHQVQQGVQADFIICGECGRGAGTYEIANEAKGVAALELHFNGESAHGAYPWRGDNMAVKATEFIRKLYERFPAPLAATGKTTITVTGVSAGGAAHNQIPGFAAVKIDCRYAPDDPRFASPEAITELIHMIDPEATIARFLTYGPPIYTNPRNPLLLELKAAAEQVEGEPFKFVRRNGSGDGRFYTSVSGQACEFGIAGGNQHGDDEHITLDAFRNYLETMRVFLNRTLAPEAAVEREAAKVS